MENQDSTEKKSADNKEEIKDLNWASKLDPGAGIFPFKFQLEGPSRLVSNNGPLTRYFNFIDFFIIN